MNIIFIFTVIANINFFIIIIIIIIMIIIIIIIIINIIIMTTEALGNNTINNLFCKSMPNLH